MRFLLDANMPYSSLAIIRSFGHGGFHSSDIGLSTATDEEILAYASKKKLVVITKDLDFGTLTINMKMKSYGLIILRLPFTYTAVHINSALGAFFKTVKIGNLRNAITIIELGRYRIRKI